MRDQASNPDRSKEAAAFQAWMRLTESSANLKSVIAIWSVVLLMSILIIEQDRHAPGLGGATLYVSYMVFCGYLSNFHFRAASLMLATPNLLGASACLLLIYLLQVSGRNRADDVFMWVLVAGMSFVGLYAAASARSYSSLPAESDSDSVVC